VVQKTNVQNINILTLSCFTSLFITLQQKDTCYVHFWFYKLGRFSFVGVGSDNYKKGL